MKQYALPRRLPRESRAFTLVELLIAMSLSVLIGGVLYLLQSTGLQTVNTGATRITLQSEARRNLEQLAQDLRCARDIIQVTSKSLRVLRWVPSDDGEINSNAAMQTVEYRLEKSNTNESIFVRQVEREEAKTMIRVNNIEPEIFFPYYEDPDRFFRPFNMKENDSGQRKRITFMVVQLRLRQGKELFAIRTAVSMRAPHERIQQPNWKFR